METVLVTGLNGFTGRYVQAELEDNGYKVIGLSSDLTDAEALSAEIEQVRPHKVVHLAAIAFVGHGAANAFYEVNLIGTRNLLVSLENHAPDVNSILLASSANVYGNRSAGVLSEDTLPDPVNDYAVSKFAMEQMSHLWDSRLPLFIVRPFNYTGVGQKAIFVIPKIVAHFKEKKPVIKLGNLDVWREFGDVRIVAGIYRKLLENCPVGETLNVCTGQAYSLREVIAICEKITKHKIEIKVDSSLVRANEVHELKGDNHRLKKYISDWKSSSLEETLAWLLEES